jgi:hypothetical protein
MGFGFNAKEHSLETAIMSKNPFFLTPEFYKNLFAASAILQKPSCSLESGSKIIDAQNFARNLFFSSCDDKEVKSQKKFKN